MEEEDFKKEILKGVNDLLSQQTVVILGAVEEKLEKSELRINEKIEKLSTTLDNFLKKLTDTETEFISLREDLKRIKKVLKEKLGIDLL